MAGFDFPGLIRLPPRPETARERGAVEARINPGERLTPLEHSSYASGHLASRPLFGPGVPSMHRPNAQEFVQSLLETLDDLPPDFVQRFAEILTREDADRSQAIRQLFEELTGE